MAAVIVLLFLSVLGMSLITYVYVRSETTLLESDRLKALYLAEAGIAQSLHELKWDTDFDGNGLGDVAPHELGGGTFSAKHDFQSSYILGTGAYNKVRRVVQLQYSAL
jgi:hypothetical protein